MKTFLEFDPLHPQLIEETLQIKHRKIYLSHIPLKSSITIHWFIQADTPSEVTSNSFWCDYRDADGYRSANGEVIFDSTANDRFVDVSYLAIGTVLRAKDVNEVATSLDSLALSQSDFSSQVRDLGIRIGVLDEESQRRLNLHNQNPIAHPDIVESLKSTNTAINTQLETFNARIEGFTSNITTKVESIQSSQHDLKDELISSIATAESRIYLNVDNRLQILPEIRNEFTSVYNQLSLIDEKYSKEKESTIERVENLLAIERISANTALNNAKTEILNRSIAESEMRDESLRAEIIDKLEEEANRRETLSEQISSVDSHLTDVTYQIPSLRSLLNAEQYARIDADNELNGLIVTYREQSTARDDSIQSNIANLSNTLYQARQATNIAIESLRANIAIAEDRMLNTADRFESFATNIHNLNESLSDEIAEVVEIQEDMTNYIDSKFEPVRLEFSESIRAESEALSSSIENLDSAISSLEESIDLSISALDFDLDSLDADVQDFKFDVDGYFSQIEESIAAVWDQFGQVSTSVSAIDYFDESIIASLGNTNSSIGTLNTKATNIQTSLGNTNTSLNNVTTRVTNLEKKHNPFTLATVSSTINGAIWYIF